MNREQINAKATETSVIGLATGMVEGRRLAGRYDVKFYEDQAAFEAGNPFREDVVENVITNVGLNLTLDTLLAS